MSLRVLHPGAYTLVVDGGRPASRRWGVPVGGAADRRSLALGNALLGNPPAGAALEIAIAGPRLVAETTTACVVVGAVLPCHAGGRRLALGKTFTLAPGDELELGSIERGMRSYLCVRGGFETPVVLGSRTGLAPVRRGDLLPASTSSIHARFVVDAAEVFPDEVTLQVVPGVEASWFDTDELCGGAFTVTPVSNRMGLRLEGRPLKVPDRELVSEPVAPGAVQVTRDGNCVILGVDGQTIGGYPKIAHVIQADLDRVGQLRPGAKVRFAFVSLDEAQRLNRESQRQLQEQVLRLRVSVDALDPARVT